VDNEQKSVEQDFQLPDAEDLGGLRPTDAEFEERIRIVEKLIILGYGQTCEQVAAGLDKAKRPGLARSTIAKYMALARERLREADDAVKAARREEFFRNLLQTHSDIRSALKSHNVAPTWRDLIDLERLTRDVYLGGPRGNGELLPALPREAVDAGVDEHIKANELMTELLKAYAEKKA
jgi:hypothetical protein